jgi:predicted nucleic acid-binding protein
LADHLPHFEILSVTEPTTLTYARVRASLKKLGRPIPANDTWIAALALQHRLPVMSRDEHFDAVPGLRREAW